jgi:hypothetical protein
MIFYSSLLSSWLAVLDAQLGSVATSSKWASLGFSE